MIIKQYVCCGNKFQSLEEDKELLYCNITCELNHSILDLDLDYESK